MPVEDNAWFNKKMFRGLKASGYVKADKKGLLVFIVNYATMHKTTKKNYTLSIQDTRAKVSQ